MEARPQRSSDERGRLLLLTQEFPSRSETFIASRFAGLLDLGWDVHVCCRQANFDLIDALPALRDRRVAGRIHSATSWHGIGRFKAIFTALGPLLREPRQVHRFWAGLRSEEDRRGALRSFLIEAPVMSLRPDIVHFEFGAQARGRADLRALLGICVTASFRGFDLEYAGLDLREGETDLREHYREVWPHLSRVHVLGEGLSHRARQRGCPPDLVKDRIPPAIDPEFFKPGTRTPSSGPSETTDDQSLRLVSVGRLVWKKGYHYGVRALAELARKGQNVQWSIVGDGPERQAIAFEAHRYGLSDQVRLLGWQSPESTRDHLDRADVFLHTAVSEGFCNAVLEAQAMCLPVVTTDATGLAENVEDGVTGFVVPRRDPRALANQLHKLANARDLRVRFGRAGRQRVLDHFRIDQQTERFDRFYRQALEEHRQDRERAA